MPRMILAGVAFLFAALSMAHGQGASPHADITLISERDQTQPGDAFFVAFDMVLDPEWHVYWRNPGDSGLPPQPVWADNMGADPAEFIWPTPDEIVVLEDELLDYGYSDRVVLPLQIRVRDDAAGELHLAGTLRYLICKDICIPEEADFELNVPVGDTLGVNEVVGRTISEWVAKTPSSFDGEACLVTESEKDWSLSLAAADLIAPADYVRFFPYNNEIRHASAQTVKHGARGVTLGLTPGYAPEIGAALEGVIVVDRAGEPRLAYEMSAPVCTSAIAGTAAGSGTAIASLGGASGGDFNLFAIAGLALLGGLILNLMPCVLPVLSIKAVGMVNATVQGDARHLRAHGIWYTAGVILSFLAIAGVFIGLRAAGEIVSIGFQLQFAPIVAGLALLMFVIGLWLLGVFELGSSLQNIGGGLAAKQGSAGAFFTGVLAAVVGAPCIGPFLGVALGAVITQPGPVVLLVFGIVGLGLALPFLLLSFVPGLQRVLPKPGAWMERLKQFFAFPMFLTAAWLLSVLGSQAGTDAMVWTAVGAVLIGFGIWALSNAGGRVRLVAAAFGVAMLTTGTILPIQASLTGSPAGAETAEVFAGSFTSESWEETRVDELIGEGRGVFVDFTATWCVTCQLNKRTTLNKEAVQQAFADNDIVFMVADFTNRDEAIAAALFEHSQPGVPMYLYYAPGSATPKLLPQLLSVDMVLDEIANST